MRSRHQNPVKLLNLHLYLLSAIFFQVNKDDIVNLCHVSKKWYQGLSQNQKLWTNVSLMKYGREPPENYDAFAFYLKPFGNLYFDNIMGIRLIEAVPLMDKIKI